MTKVEKEEQIRHLKSEASTPKDRLIDILFELEDIDEKEAKRLASIIGRLEYWQNSGIGGKGGLT